MSLKWKNPINCEQRLNKIPIWFKSQSG